MTRIRKRLQRLYGSDNIHLLEERFFRMIGRYGVGRDLLYDTDKRWDRSDVALITYADSIQREGEAPLATLHRFCTQHLRGAIKTVHLLPFFPWTSDDGFSVVDYRAVAPENGRWEDIEALGKDFNLMYDLVLNHCSAKSGWFKDFVTGIDPARQYFIECDPEKDYSQVTRPRTSPLLTPVMTKEGEKHVWTTFSADQVDLNWENPDVLFEFLDILFQYIASGVRILRLDAVAFLWKELGTDCIHRPETHEVVKLFRDVLDMVAPHVILLTETNVPHKENVSYFGKGDEAHMVYNFSLPPLVLHALLTGDGSYLTKWAQELDPLPKGCTWFNFTASHDGIGVRPIQGILPDKELKRLVKETKERGGRVSMKTNPDGKQSPYELNITYRSALEIPGEVELSRARFLCSQALALSFQGMPAVYIHSLLGTPNYQDGVERTKHNRTINRRKYNEAEIAEFADDREHDQGGIFQRYLQMLRRRANHPAFHPEGAMKIHDFGKDLFALTRTSPSGEETVHCIYNLTAKDQVVYNPQTTPELKKTKSFYDILSARTLSSGKKGLTLHPYQALWLTARE